MVYFYMTYHSMLLVALWTLSRTLLCTAWTGTSGGKPKADWDPNLRAWGDYSDLPTGIEHGLGLEEEREHEDHRGAGEPSSNLAPELEFLADFAGKKRLWVITAPSHNDNYLRMMEKQLEDMDQKSLNCHLAERDTFIITIIQNAMMEGRIHKTTVQGIATVENLDPDTVTKLLHYLELSSQDQTFTMLVMRKNLQVSERFPYPVRIEAILEIIDQFPVRKLEKMTGKGSKCKIKKKKVVVKRKKIMKKVVLPPQRALNRTSVMAPQRQPIKNNTALVRLIQGILNGESRFVIHKKPVVSARGKAPKSNGWETSKVSSGTGSVSRIDEQEKDRPPSTTDKGKEREGRQNTKNEKEPNTEAETENKESTKKKGKGKKGKERKGRGKKANREVTEEDKTALRMFLDRIKGSRRLMLISTPSRDTSLYIQQTDENKKQQCELAIRKITVANIVGEGSDAAISVQHQQLESERPLTGQMEKLLDSRLIPLLRAEFGLSSPDLFSMTVTDYDIKPKRVYEAPPSSPALFEYIDNFPSRYSEIEKERRSPAKCSQDMEEPVVENSLLRFMSKRRLLVISAPSEDDYSFQHQIPALSGQECHLGIRHFALLKLTGNGQKASGSVELYPINGRSQSEVEPLPRDVVNNLREQLKISKDYFSVLVVGKDGDVKAVFLSPMWSLDSIYDLVDSMELRMQEASLQRSVGIQCQEDVGRETSEAGHYPGYDEDGADRIHFYE